MSATIIAHGDAFAVQTSDGTVIPWADIKKEVLGSLHETLQCDIRVIKNEQNGNYQLSFDNSLFVGVDRSLAREENDRRRSTAIGKRFAFLGTLTNVLAKYGLKFGEHVSPRDTRQVRDQNTGNTRWSATTQMWINTPGGTQAAAPAARTDEQLMTAAIKANRIDAGKLLSSEDAFDAEGKLTGKVKGRLTFLIAMGNASSEPDKPAPSTGDQGTGDGDGDDMPTD